MQGDICDLIHVLQVWAPSNATTESKLPVYFFISGGGFNALSNTNYNGSGLIQAAEMDMVVVTFSYRVGLFGFLASTEIQADGQLNVGLLDQRKALDWTNKYISKVSYNTSSVFALADTIVVRWGSLSRHHRW